MDRRKQGNIAEAKAISKLTELGYTVSVPLTENNPYDLVVEEGGKLQTVQVKSTSRESDYGGYEVNIRTTYKNNNRMAQKKHEEGSFDLLFVHTPEEQYLIPEEKFDARTSIVVREGNKYEENRLGR